MDDLDDFGSIPGNRCTKPEPEEKKVHSRDSFLVLERNKPDQVHSLASYLISQRSNLTKALHGFRFKLEDFYSDWTVLKMTRQVQRHRDYLEKLYEDILLEGQILIDQLWDEGVMAENGPQLFMYRHMLSTLQSMIDKADQVLDDGGVLEEKEKTSNGSKARKCNSRVG